VEDYFQGNFMVLPAVLWGHVCDVLMSRAIITTLLFHSWCRQLTVSIWSQWHLFYPVSNPLFMFCHYHIRSGTINTPRIVHKMFSMLPNYHCQVSAFGEPTTTLLLLSW